MSTILDDLRLATRRLRRSPGFTAVAVVSLALAIGANTAVFGLVDAAVFARLPLPDADRIVRLWEERPARNWSRFGVSAPAFADWRAQAASLARVAAYAPRSVNIAGSERPERARLVEATSEVFDVLGVRPRLGRAFTREAETAGRDAVVLLAFDFWRGAFAGDPGVVGRTVALDGVPHVVIGVLPPEVAAFDDAQLWRPLALGVDTRRGARWLEVVARLRPGVAVHTARAELVALARQPERAYPDTNTLAGAVRAQVGRSIRACRSSPCARARTWWPRRGRGGAWASRCSACSRRSRPCWPRWGSTASCRTPRASAPARSACAWPSARGRGTFSRLVFGESLALAAAGAALGLAGAAASGRLLSSLLFDVRPGDPVTVAASAAALALVALGSAFAPARRASRLDPLAALRDE